MPAVPIAAAIVPTQVAMCITFNTLFKSSFQSDVFSPIFFKPWKSSQLNPLSISRTFMILSSGVIIEISIFVPSKFVKLYEWAGCDKCGKTWYLGRIGIYEIISLSDPLRELIRDGATTEEILLEARNWDFIDMKEDGVLKAIKWFTTIEELLRVI